MNIIQSIVQDVISPNDRLDMLFDFSKVVNSDKLPELIDKLYAVISKLKPDAIIGSGYGGAQLCGGLTAKYGIRSIIVRSQPHKRQDNRQVEGDLTGVNKLVLVDDAIFTGSSIRELLVVVGPTLAAKVTDAVVLYDDWRPLGTRQLEQQGITVTALAARRELGLTRDATSTLTYEQVSSALVHKPSLTVGSLAWADYEGNASAWWMKSTPLIYNDLVINATDDYCVTAYKLLTGELTWEYRFPNHAQATSKGIVQNLKVADNGRLYVGAYDGSLACLEPMTGLLNWLVKLDSNIHATPIYDPLTGLVFINTEAYQEAAKVNGGALKAVHAETGLLAWAHTHSEFPPSTVTLAGELVLAAANDCTLSGFAKLDGELQWTFVTKSTVKAAGLVVDDHVFFIDHFGWLYKLEHTTGKLIWCIRGAKSSWMVTPVKLGPNVLVWDSLDTSSSYMYAYDSVTGSRAYVHKYRSPTAGVVKLSESDLLVAGSFTQLAYIRDHQKLWEINGIIPGCTLASAPAISLEHGLICFNMRSGGLHTYKLD